MHPSASLCVAAACLGSIVAQTPDPAPEPVKSIQYGETRSRSLFTVADADADDRLDLFEAAAALGTIGDSTNVAGFRRLDLDRDGFLEWREFDSHFRSVIHHGEAMFVQPARPWTEGLEERIQPLSETPGRRTFLLFDADRTGGLSLDELAALVDRMGLPTALRARFAELDRNRSGEVSFGEFTPWNALLPDLGKPLPKPDNDDSLLATPYGGADTDEDHRLSFDEIRVSLRRLDPQLGRWAQKVVDDADRDGDGALGLADLRSIPVVARE